MGYNEIDIGILREFLSYDPATGSVKWTKKAGRKVVVGAEAGAARKDGRRIVGFMRRRFLLSRVSWALHYGKWPDNEVDHRDGDPSNNRLLNLRAATSSQQKRNRVAFSSSGIKGVYWIGPRNKYRAQIKVGEGTRYLGYFSDKEEARKVRIAAEKELGVFEFSRAL
jgi:hypothetical protein